jgi:hypothetical protein
LRRWRRGRQVEEVQGAGPEVENLVVGGQRPVGQGQEGAAEDEGLHGGDVEGFGRVATSSNRETFPPRSH